MSFLGVFLQVVLFDCERWRELRLTETIEDLVEAFVQSRARLWRGGISQPPFLLALAGAHAPRSALFSLFAACLVSCRVLAGELGDLQHAFSTQTICDGALLIYL